MNRNRMINGAEFPYFGEIVYNDGGVIVNDPQDGTGRVNVYKLSEFKTPMRGASARGWLCCGAWRRIITGYRETETYGREAKTARDLAGVASAYA